MDYKNQNKYIEFQDAQSKDNKDQNTEEQYINELKHWFSIHTETEKYIVYLDPEGYVFGIDPEILNEKNPENYWKCLRIYSEHDGQTALGYIAKKIIFPKEDKTTEKEIIQRLQTVYDPEGLNKTYFKKESECLSGRRKNSDSFQNTFEGITDLQLVSIIKSAKRLAQPNFHAELQEKYTKEKQLLNLQKNNKLNTCTIQ